MSELISHPTVRNMVRWQLLTGVSALALVGSLVAVPASASGDSDRPTVWIELGGQLEGLDTKEETFAPPFLFAAPRPMPQTASPLAVEGQPGNSFGGEGKISIQPNHSDWVFSAALRFGRSSFAKSFHQQSYPTKGIPAVTPQLTSHVPIVFRKALQFIDGSKTESESHTILDFQAGKDVGLGMFGARSSSVLNLGVRFAQFESKSNLAFKSDPDAHPTYLSFYIFKLFLGGAYHFNTATAEMARSFHGVGPSLSWNATVPVFGGPEKGSVSLDWGLNAAALFGRQKARVHHQTTAQYHHGGYVSQGYTTNPNLRTTLYRHTPPDQARSHSIIVPNLGGFAGLSFNYADAKLSVGYRADFFFGATDGGVDTRKSENIGFYGPFAAISIGLP